MRAVCIAACLLVASVAALSFEKVHLIDYIQGPTSTHYFYRSDEPVHKDPYFFEYAKLVEYMGTRALNASAPWPDHMPWIFDICTLNFLKHVEREDMEHEKSFFAANASLGVYHNWVLIGNLIDPNTMSASKRRDSMATYKALDPDQLVHRIAAVRANLEQARTDTGNQSRVTMVHCEGGDDRTGEFSAAYVMQYKNYTMKQALTWDDGIAGRSIAWASRNGALWYCWYLTYELGYTNLACDDI